MGVISRAWHNLPSPILVASVLALCLAGCNSSRVEGYGTALDGDTLVIGKDHVRLMRIDAPELEGHLCPTGRRPSCNDRDPDYAAESQRALQRLLDTGAVTCTSGIRASLVPLSKDVYGRYLAECYTTYGTNISDVMLASAMAVPYQR